MSIGKMRAGAAQPKGQWITTARRLALYLRDGFACVYCGTFLHMAQPSDITLDHLKPRSEGGSNESRNLVTACRSCNSSRSFTPWRVYASPEARVRIERFIRRVPNIRLAKSILAGTASDPRVEDKDLDKPIVQEAS